MFYCLIIFHTLLQNMYMDIVRFIGPEGSIAFGVR